MKKMAKKKDYLASDRSSHQRKISSARVSKESSNSKGKKQKDKKKMKYDKQFTFKSNSIVPVGIRLAKVTLKKLISPFRGQLQRSYL